MWRNLLQRFTKKPSTEITTTEEIFVNLFRIYRSDQGTEGILSLKDFSCFVMELPWRNNEQNRSCIPPGQYDAIIRYSEKFKVVYWILKVEGRAYIYIHAGNFGGDVSKGLKSNTYGCLLLGKHRGKINGQRAVFLSRLTLRKFMKLMQGRPFKLNIIEAF